MAQKLLKMQLKLIYRFHKELRRVLEKEDPNFTNGRGDEGGWAPKLENQKR